MPVYEYLCDACGHQFEVAQRMTDDAISACEKCGGAVQRLLFAPAIHFKGSGFHNTDYGTKKRPKDTSSDGAKSDGAKSDGPAKSDGGSKGTAAPAKKAAEATPTARARRGTGP